MNFCATNRPQFRNLFLLYFMGGTANLPIVLSSALRVLQIFMVDFLPGQSADIDV
jgi:hypothetical protein